jgi:hypothetical protein
MQAAESPVNSIQRSERDPAARRALQIKNRSLKQNPLTRKRSKRIQSFRQT